MIKLTILVTKFSQVGWDSTKQKEHTYIYAQTLEEAVATFKRDYQNTESVGDFGIPLFSTTYDIIKAEKVKIRLETTLGVIPLGQVEALL